jgi:hypothetical protein
VVGPRPGSNPHERVVADAETGRAVEESLLPWSRGVYRFRPSRRGQQCLDEVRTEETRRIT